MKEECLASIVTPRAIQGLPTLFTVSLTEDLVFWRVNLGAPLPLKLVCTSFCSSRSLIGGELATVELAALFRVDFLRGGILST